MSNVTQMDLIRANIEYHAQGASNKEITQNILREWRGSQPIEDMKQAQAYLEVKNTEIEKKTRSYRDEEDKLIINDTLSNVKTKTAQYRKSVNQKINFSLRKPFVISCDNKKYKEMWEKFLTPEMRAVITRTGKSGINKGIGWSYVWINEKGNLEIVDTVSETIYPAWHDNAHTELDSLVRDYKIIEYNANQTPQTIQKVEYWDKEIVEKYIDYSQATDAGTGDLVPDTNGEFELGEGEEERATIQQTHLKKEDGSGESWERVPFIFFKGCDDELPLLNECKSDIDSYDLTKSKGIDSILDDIDAVLVVEDISPEMGELASARKMVQNSRIVSVERGGKAHFEKVDANITAIAQQLELIKKDIQDNTSTVDLTTIQLGTNPSGKSMKTFYESLNIWCNGFEAEFRVFMSNLKYFFDKWLSWYGGFGTFEQLQAIPITFELDRDMIIDETEIIDNVVKLQDKISQETLDEMNPWVENHEKEQERRDNEEKKRQEQDELYKFDTDIDDDGFEDEDVEDEEQEKQQKQDKETKLKKNDAQK